MKNSVSRILIVYILLFSSAITLILTLGQLYMDYKYDVKLIKNRFEVVEVTNLDSIRQSLWTVNYDALKLQLEGIQRLPDIIHLTLTDTQGKILVEAGEPELEHTLSHSVPIFYTYRGHQQYLGDLHITSSLKGVYQRLLETALVILVTQGIKTFLVTLFIFLIFHRLITRHLGKLAHFAQTLDPRREQPALQLDRTSSRWTESDELETVTRAFNQMMSNTRQAFQEADLRRQEIEQAQELAKLGHWQYDVNHGRFRLSAHTSRLLGLGNNATTMDYDAFVHLIHPQDKVNFSANLNEAIHADAETLEPFEYRYRHPYRGYIHVQQTIRRQHNAKDTNLLGALQDISGFVENRKQLEMLANVDGLTGLANRNRFFVELHARLDQMRKTGKTFVVALADLDGFKEINDSLGHHAGDQLLKEIQPRFTPILRSTDLAARLGGDEFAFIIEGGDRRAVEFARELRESLAQPFLIKGIHIRVDISIGLSLAPVQSEVPSELVRFADVAMYSAKRKKLGFKIYDPHEDLHGTRRLELIADLRNAIDSDQLELHYQPKISLANRICNGLEALIRWHHPVYGMIPPDEFISFAEMSDLIHPLTDWVIRRSARDLQQIRRIVPTCAVSINISTRNLLNRSFAQEIRDIVAKEGFAPSDFVLEITESAIMEDPNQARVSIDQLASLGFALSIDDFGTGYSSLSYLKHLPVSELKIDRSFVMDMLEDNSDATIVKSTVDLAHNLGLSVVAEGVENSDIENRLLDLGCDVAQGYHYSRPLPLPQLLTWMEQRQGNNNT